LWCIINWFKQQSKQARNFHKESVQDNQIIARNSKEKAHEIVPCSIGKSSTMNECYAKLNSKYLENYFLKASERSIGVGR